MVKVHVYFPPLIMELGLHVLTRLREGTMVKLHVYFPPLIMELGLLFSHRLGLTLQEVAPHIYIRGSQDESPGLQTRAGM